MRVCLASTSPARLMLLRQAGIEPLTLAPDVDEDAVIRAVETAEARTLAPDEHVLLLARRKAADVAARIVADDPTFDGLVIGGDSMFELDGEILGKPHTPENATARWIAMRGKTGVLHSGHSVFRVGPGIEAREAHAVAHASVTFADDGCVHDRQPRRPVHRADRGRPLDRRRDVSPHPPPPRARAGGGVDEPVASVVDVPPRSRRLLVGTCQNSGPERR
jgi:predicted house-cleaning NTP pyrophosphatase (Maf/HAM1 superfamily)